MVLGDIIGRVTPARSTSLSFFAVRTDQEALLDFILSETSARVFESHGEPDRELREFRSLAEISAAYALGNDVHGNANVALFRLWSPSVMRKPPIRRIELDPSTGYKSRLTIDGGGVISLDLGGQNGNVITRSQLAHMSEGGSSAWGTGDGIEWNELTTIANRLTCHVKRLLATGKAKGAYVLSEAMKLAMVGHELKLATQTPWAYAPEPLPPRKPRRAR